MYKLLICDDEELSREGLSEYVKSIRNDIEIIGYGRDGIEAISKISDLKPQIVLMDINLPFKDGLEVIETVKESEQQLFYIIVSGYSDFAYAQKAIRLGVPVEKAYKIASYNAAQFYKINSVGAVGAGHLADLVVLNDVNNVDISMVIKNGNIVDDKWISSFEYELKDESLLHTVLINEINVDDIKCQKSSDVLELVPYQLLTLHKKEEIPGINDEFVPNAEYSKLVVVERHGKNGKIGVCPMKGYGIINGAVATTVSHDSHNIIAAGDNDEDIVCAINKLKEIQGGYVIASGGEVVDVLQLSLAGLLSVDKAENVQKQTGKMVGIARNMGVVEGVDPFTTLSFMALTVIPEVRLTEKGMFDVTQMKFI